MIASIMTIDGNKILIGHFGPGSSICMHTHVGSCETIFITSDRGEILIDDGMEALSEESCHFCPRGSSHSMINTGSEGLCFMAVMTEQ